MKGIVIVSEFWTHLFSFGKANAITLFPFIFFSHPIYAGDKSLLNHENIHIRQAVELFVLPFYIWYLLAFLIHYVRYKDFNRAYRAISFEKEAYENENNVDYLRKCKFWAFIKY